MPPSLPVLNVAVGVVVRDGLILITRRPVNVPLAGLWEFPGGKLEPGETPEAAVVRELQEELRLSVVPQRRLSQIVHDYPQARVVLTPMYCVIVAGEPQAIGCSEFRWVHPHALITYDFPAANRPLLDELITIPLQNLPPPDTLARPNPGD
ncbi:MAG TPA: 8-oxo-dGTP diphosphatase MutT [Tepidisphaeraceae bacterium]|jgi:8-oxo-dGTP diphosphatase